MLVLQAGGVVDKVKVAVEDKDAEGGLYAVKALAETADAACESYVVAMLPLVMEKYADKVQTPAGLFLRQVGSAGSSLYHARNRAQ